MLIILISLNIQWGPYWWPGSNVIFSHHYSLALFSYNNSVSPFLQCVASSVELLSLTMMLFWSCRRTRESGRWIVEVVEPRENNTQLIEVKVWLYSSQQVTVLLCYFSLQEREGSMWGEKKRNFGIWIGPVFWFCLAKIIKSSLILLI